jgi:hypothetical protein
MEWIDRHHGALEALAVDLQFPCIRFFPPHLPPGG